MTTRQRVFWLQAAVLGALLVSITGGRLRFPGYRVDLDVYRLGSLTLLHGGDLYGTLPLTQDGQHLAFTYPPIAAILLTPLAVIPYWMASVLLTLLTVGLLAVVLRLVLRSVSALPADPAIFLLLLAGVEVLEPVRTAIWAGQVDVLLLALVVLDVLTDSPRWPRGVLIGLAAAVKLTPAVFVLYLLLRRDTRAALTAGLSFLVATGVGFLYAGQDSIRYWGGLVFQDNRVGMPVYAGNQSLLGLLTRLGVPDRSAVWVVLAVVVVALTVLAMRRALAAENLALALSLNALCGLLISPISWSHHWVWAVVLLPVLAVGSRKLAAAGLLIFVVSPQWWWPRGNAVEAQWSPLQQLTGSAYVLFGLALLGMCASRWGGTTLCRPTKIDQTTASGNWFGITGDGRSEAPVR